MKKLVSKFLIVIMTLQMTFKTLVIGYGFIANPIVTTFVLAVIASSNQSCKPKPVEPTQQNFYLNNFIKIDVNVPKQDNDAILALIARFDIANDIQQKMYDLLVARMKQDALFYAQIIAGNADLRQILQNLVNEVANLSATLHADSKLLLDLLMQARLDNNANAAAIVNALNGLGIKIDNQTTVQQHGYDILNATLVFILEELKKGRLEVSQVVSMLNKIDITLGKIDFSVINNFDPKIIVSVVINQIKNENSGGKIQSDSAWVVCANCLEHGNNGDVDPLMGDVHTDYLGYQLNNLSVVDLISATIAGGRVYKTSNPSIQPNGNVQAIAEDWTGTSDTAVYLAEKPYVLDFQTGSFAGTKWDKMLRLFRNPENQTKGEKFDVHITSSARGGKVTESTYFHDKCNESMNGVSVFLIFNLSPADQKWLKEQGVLIGKKYVTRVK